MELRGLYRLPQQAVTQPLYEFAPPSFLFRLADMRGVADWLRSPRRNQVLSTLERHLGNERDERELRLIARRYMEFRRRWQFTTLWPMREGFAGSDAIAVDGMEHLDRALAEKNGAVLASAHFGHSYLIKPILRSYGRSARLVGYPSGGRGPLERLSRLPGGGRKVERWKERLGVDLTIGVNLREYLAVLARNECLVILVDGWGGHVNHRIRVLGVEVGFASGPVRLARQTGAAVLPTFVVDDREHNGEARLRLLIKPPLALQVTGRAHEDLKINLERFAAAYEEVAQQYPHDWFWLWVQNGAFINPFR